MCGGEGVRNEGTLQRVGLLPPSRCPSHSNIFSPSPGFPEGGGRERVDRPSRYELRQMTWPATLPLTWMASDVSLTLSSVLRAFARLMRDTGRTRSACIGAGGGGA